MNYRKGLLILLGLGIPLTINPQEKSLISEWRQTYHIDDENVLTQDLKTGIASFIFYLAAQKPSNKYFELQLNMVLARYSGYPNEFKQALIKIYNNSFKQAYRDYKQKHTQAYNVSYEGDIPLNTNTWKKALSQYYDVVYQKLDKNHKKISYGRRRGQGLPKQL